MHWWLSAFGSTPTPTPTPPLFLPLSFYRCLIINLMSWDIELKVMKMHKSDYRTYSHRDAKAPELRSIFLSECSFFDSFQSSHFHAGLLLLCLHAATTWTGGTITRKQMATQERCLPMSFSGGMSRDSVWLFVPRAKHTWLTYTETGKTCSLAETAQRSVRFDTQEDTQIWYDISSVEQLNPKQIISVCVLGNGD